MASRTSPDGISHQSYQAAVSSLGLTYGAHSACSSGYAPQSFCTTYNHYPLNQEVESATGFPQCGPLMYSGNISSSVVPQHRQGYGGTPLGQLQYSHSAYGSGHEQTSPFPGCSNPLSPLHAAHLEACCSPLSEGASSAQTFDWMKVKRNPPKTGRYNSVCVNVSVCVRQNPWPARINCMYKSGVRVIVNEFKYGRSLFLTILRIYVSYTV